MGCQDRGGQKRGPRRAGKTGALSQERRGTLSGARPLGELRRRQPRSAIMARPAAMSGRAAGAGTLVGGGGGPRVSEKVTALNSAVMSLPEES